MFARDKRTSLFCLFANGEGKSFYDVEMRSKRAVLNTVASVSSVAFSNKDDDSLFVGLRNGQVPIFQNWFRH
jgi:hypothetical protein